MAEDKKPALQPWKPPIALPGETVYWSVYKGTEKLIGLVTSNTGTALNLTLFGDGSHAIRTVRGVRHVGDPRLKSMIDQPGGVWEHTEMGKRLHGLLD